MYFSIFPSLMYYSMFSCLPLLEFPFCFNLTSGHLLGWGTLLHLHYILTRISYLSSPDVDNTHLFKLLSESVDSTSPWGLSLSVHCQCPDSLALHPGASQFIPFCKSRLKFHSYSKPQVEPLVTHKSHHHSLNGSYFALYVFISLVSLYTFFLSSRVSLLIFIQDFSFKTHLKDNHQYDTFSVNSYYHW